MALVMRESVGTRGKKKTRGAPKGKKEMGEIETEQERLITERPVEILR